MGIDRRTRHGCRMNSVTTAAIAETVLVTYRQIGQGKLAGAVPARQPHVAPLPSTYTAIVIVYGVLHLIPGNGAKVASAIGWGLVVATFLNLWNPGPASVTGLKNSAPAVVGGATPKASPAAATTSTKKG